MGPASSGAGGPEPLTFAEIAAWRQLAGVRLTPWQARALRNLSRDYVAELAAAESPVRLAPWRPATTEQQRADVATDLRRRMRGVVNNDEDED